MGEVLDAPLRASPAREALIGRNRRYTYAELDDEVNRAAHAFAAAGVRQGDRVAASLPNDTDIVVAFLGAMRLATARRIFRPPPPLPSIRSLHYFLPVIDEIQKHDVDPEYLEYLEYKLRHSCPIYRPLQD